MKITLFDPVLTGISGTTALDSADIGGVAIPPDLVSLGVKRWIDPADLRFIKKHRQAVLRTMRRLGVAFGSVYIVPDEDLVNCRTQLDEIRETLYAERDALAQDIDRKVNAWALQHPDWETHIRAAALSGKEIKERIQMRVREYEIQIGGTTDESPETNAMLDGLEGQLALDVRGLVKDGWTAGRSKTNRRALRVLDRVRHKLNTLSWICPATASAAIDMIDSYLASVPNTGLIEGADFVRLESLMDWLSNPSRLLSGVMDDCEANGSGDNVTGSEDYPHDFERPLASIGHRAW